MERRDASSISMEGIPTRLGSRHAFLYERLMLLIVRETLAGSCLSCGKADLARLLSCNQLSMDRAVHKLKLKRFIAVKPRFAPNGAQAVNEYCATGRGIKYARLLLSRYMPVQDEGGAS